MDAGITGSDDVTPVNDIVEGKMMLQQKGSFFFNARKRLHTEYPLKQRPETILGMSIEEAVFSGFDGGKGTQDQDLRIGPKTGMSGWVMV